MSNNSGANVNSVPLIGREKEYITIIQFLQKALYTYENESKKQPFVLYITGKPGTGKTATVRRVLDNCPKWFDGIKKSSLNQRRKGNSSLKLDFTASFILPIFIECVSFQECLPSSFEAALLAKILDQLCSSSKSHEKKAMRVTMDHLLSTVQEKTIDGKVKIVIVFDEIDTVPVDVIKSLLLQISTRIHSNELQNSSLALIGIDNSLNLNGQLPRLRADLRPPPDVLPFSPYNKQQIRAILQNHIITTLGNEKHHFIDSTLLDLCAMKAAKQSGDIRVAFSLLGQTIEETVSLKSNGNEKISAKKNERKRKRASGDTKNGCEGNVDVLKKIREVGSIDVQRLAAIKALPYHPKIVLLILARLLQQQPPEVSSSSSKSLPIVFKHNNGSVTAITSNRLVKAYHSVCDQLVLNEMDPDQALGFLSDQALISIDYRQNKVYLRVDPACIHRAIISDQQLRDIDSIVEF